MNSADRKIPWGSLFRFALGGMLLVLVVVNACVGAADWVLSLVVAGSAVVIMMGGRRVFRPAITREPGGIVCRYVPWCEAGPYVGLVFVPLMGLCAIALGFRSDFSPMFGVAGAILLALTPLVFIKFLRGQRRCLLRITAATLRVPLPSQSYVQADLPRDRIQSITSATEKVGFGSTTLLLSEIVFTPGDAEAKSPQCVRLGPAPASDTVWLTVEPANLLAALQAWRAGNPSDPKLIDHIEAVLRGSSAS